MPQNSLLPEHQPPSALRIDIFGPSLKADREHLEVWIYTGDDRSDFMCLTIIDLPGVETDFLNTLITDVAYSWAYGEGRKDITRSAMGVKKMARAHRHEHEF